MPSGAAESISQPTRGSQDQFGTVAEPISDGTMARWRIPRIGFGRRPYAIAAGRAGRGVHGDAGPPNSLMLHRQLDVLLPIGESEAESGMYPRSSLLYDQGG